jgi:threonine synthase
MMYRCANCNDLLEVKYDYETLTPIDTNVWKSRDFSVWRYRELLPMNPTSRIISLGEGGTGLHRSEHLADDLNVKSLSVKFEGENPTGSFKDRGMTVSISKAIELHAKMVACASTGNTSASLAAYAAKAGLRSIVLVPAARIAQGKLAQAVVHGATILEIDGNFDDSLRSVIELTERNPSIALLNSVNPFRIEGQKTLAFEVCDQLKFKSPDVLIVPVGNAGNISSIWKGFNELRRVGVIDATPRLVGVQAEGAAPLASAYKLKSDTIQPVKNPETIATAIRIGAPASWKKALRAITESGGTMETASDREILQAQKDLARREGIFAEPAGASSIVGLKKLLEEGYVERGEEIVCVATGHGLKDAEIVTRIGEKPTRTGPEVENIERILGLR